MQKSVKVLLASISLDRSCWANWYQQRKFKRGNSSLVNDLDIRDTKNNETYYPWSNRQRTSFIPLSAFKQGDNTVDPFWKK